MDNILDGLSRLGRRKPFDSLNVDLNLQTPLKRNLSTFNLLFLCLGENLGFGIFLVNGYVSKEVAGPGAVLSFVLAGVIALVPAACYAEFASKLPSIGSSYDYIYVTIGELVAFLVGWDLILEFTLRAISMAQMCSYTIDRLTGNEIRNVTLEAFQRGTPWSYRYIVDYPNIVGSVCIVVAIAIVYFGAKISAKVVSTFLILKFAVVGFTIYLGIATAGDASLNSHREGLLPYGFLGVVRGILPCYFAFTAFNTLGIAAGETKNPCKSVRRSMTFYMVISTITYVLNAVSLNLALDGRYIQSGEAYFETFSLTGHDSVAWGRYFIGFGSVCTVFSSIVVNLLCISRLLLAMCTDCLLFPCIEEETTAVNRLGLKETLIFGFVVAVVTMFIKVHAFEQFQSAGVLCSLILVSVALVVLRYTPYRQTENTESVGKKINEHDGSDTEQPHQYSRVPEAGKDPFSDGKLTMTTADGEISETEDNLQLFSVAEPTEYYEPDGILESELSRLLPRSDEESDGKVVHQRSEESADERNPIRTIPGTLKRDLHPAFQPLGRFAPGTVVATSLMATMAFQIGLAAVVTYTGFFISSKSKAWATTQTMLFGLSLVCALPIYLHYQRDRQKGISEVGLQRT